MGGWAASADFLLHLARHHLQAQPRHIVECGSGVSTIVLARCCEIAGAGHVTSLDHDPGFAQQTRQALAAYGLSAWATVIDAPLEPVVVEGRSLMWYRVQAVPEGNFDMVVVDGPPLSFGQLVRYPAGKFLLSRLSPGSHGFLDDADRPGETDAVRLWQKEFPWLQVMQLPTEKGCIALVNSQSD